MFVASQPFGCAFEGRFQTDTAGSTESAFPDLQSANCIGGQQISDDDISPSIRINLLLPEVLPCAGQFEKRTVVSVPKTTMNEYGGFILRKPQIRLAWNFTGMQSIPEAQRMKAKSHLQLGLGVLTAYARHHPAARCGINDVSHVD